MTNDALHFAFPPEHPYHQPCELTLPWDAVSFLEHVVLSPERLARVSIEAFDWRSALAAVLRVIPVEKRRAALSVGIHLQIPRGVAEELEAALTLATPASPSEPHPDTPNVFAPEQVAEARAIGAQIARQLYSPPPEHQAIDRALRLLNAGYDPATIEAEEPEAVARMQNYAAPQALRLPTALWRYLYASFLKGHQRAYPTIRWIRLAREAIAIALGLNDQAPIAIFWPLIPEEEYDEVAVILPIWVYTELAFALQAALPPGNSASTDSLDSAELSDERALALRAEVGISPAQCTAHVEVAHRCLVLLDQQMFPVFEVVDPSEKPFNELEAQTGGKLLRTALEIMRALRISGGETEKSAQ